MSGENFCVDCFSECESLYDIRDAFRGISRDGGHRCAACHEDAVRRMTRAIFDDERLKEKRQQAWRHSYSGDVRGELCRR